MPDRVDELVVEVAAGWQDCPSCGQRPRYRGIRPVISWDVEADGPMCADLWHALHPDAALDDLAAIAQEAEQLQQQMDAARAILADALHAMRDWGADEDGVPSEFGAWKAYQDGAMLLGWCIDPAASDAR